MDIKTAERFMEKLVKAGKEYGFEECAFQNSDRKLLNERKIGSAVSYDVSPERLCTYLTGLSDNFRLIYGKAASIAS